MSNDSTDSNRNEIAAPSQVRRENSPGHSDNKGAIAEINDRTGLYIAIIALALAGMALGYEMAQSNSRAEIRQLQEQTIKAEIAAGIAKAEAEANEAKVTARVALDTVKSVCAGIKANGIKNVDCH